MTLALALAIGAAVVACGAPALLRPLCRARLEPAVVMAWWLLSIVGVLLALVAGVLVLVLPGHGPAGFVVGLVHSCWLTVRHGTVPRFEEIASMAAVAAALLTVARLVWVTGSIQRSQRRTRRTQIELLELVARRDPGPEPLMWLDHPAPLAYSVAGRPGFVVATEGLARLPRNQVAAVLAHEQAHLRGHHQLMVSLVDVLARSLPFVPLLRHAPPALRMLVELAADAAAVRRCGRDAVREALHMVAGHGVPDHALAMARDAVEVRLRRLAIVGTPTGVVRRSVECGMAAVSAVVLPAAIGLGSLLLTVIVSCPTF